jgi:hypothetical protein
VPPSPIEIVTTFGLWMSGKTICGRALGIVQALPSNELADPPRELIGRVALKAIDSARRGFRVA